MKQVWALLTFMVMAAQPAWAINKCTGADGKVTYQEAPCARGGETVKVPDTPCCAPIGPPPARWRLEEERDAMTGQKSCAAVSPVQSLWVNELRTSANVRLVMAVYDQRVIVLARIEDVGTRAPIFHSTAGGMGVRAGERFYPLARRMGQKAIAASNSAELTDALLLAQEARMRLRFWPYETDYDTKAISADGLHDAVLAAAKCARGS